jgi:tetratricopeptide (TPR) repeat protein
MVLDGFSDEEILVSLPERVEPHLIFAEYLSGTGKDKMAEEEYFRALRYIRNEYSVKPDFFYVGYRYYLKNNRLGDALSIMQKGADALPDDPNIKYYMADLYEKLNMPSRAVEEYRKILAIDPRNQGAKQRLDKLLLKTDVS